MNESIISVSERTISREVKNYAEKLISARGNLVRVRFICKDGNERTMTIVPKNSYNDITGRRTTPSGRKMVNTKVNRGMVTVLELYTPEGAVGCPEAFRPRTVNLNTILEMEVIPRS